MAKRDCSELSRAIHDAIMNLASRPEVKTLDDAVTQYQKLVPGVNRQMVVEAIVEATEGTSGDADALANKINAIKREARTDKQLQNKIKELEDYIKAGAIPATKKRKAQAPPEAIRVLREVRDGLKKQLEGTTVAKLEMAKQREAKQVVSIKKQIKEIEEQIKTGKAPSKPGKKKPITTKKVRELRTKRDQLKKDLRQKERKAKEEFAKTPAGKLEAAKKREPQQLKKLRADIKELSDIIKTGKVPQKSQKKGVTVTNAVQKLRQKRDQLKKEVTQSDPVRRARVQAQIDDLTQRIKTGDIYPNPKRAETAKSKQLERMEFERDLLRKQIRSDIARLKPKTKLDRFVDIMNLPRAFRASFDLSAVRRQGGFFFMSRPFAQKGFLGDMFKAMKSEVGQLKVEKEIKNHPYRALAAKAKLDLAEVGNTTKAEDEYMTDLAERIPGIAMSERAYVTFLNSQRIGMFGILAETMAPGGNITLEEAQDIANFVNQATGRGNIGKLAQAGKVFNALFFSLRFAWSRIQIATGTPIFQAKTPRARKAIIKEYGRFLTGMGAYYLLWMIASDMYESLTGKKDTVKIEGDPRSTDFGKIRIGNTRIDPLSGISQPWVLMSRLWTQSVKSSATGEVKKIVGEDAGFGTKKPSELIGRFGRYKLAPMPSMIVNVLDRESAVGEPFGPFVEEDERPDFLGVVPRKFTDIPTSLFVPLSLEEFTDSIKEHGLTGGTALGIMAIFGEGIGTYGYEVDIKKQSTAELRKDLENSVYKRTTRSRDKETGEIVVRVKGQPHKGKAFKVEALRNELDRRGEKPQTKKTNNKSVFQALNINLEGDQ